LAETPSALAKTKFGAVAPEKLAAPSASLAHEVIAAAGCRVDGEREALRQAAQLATWEDEGGTTSVESSTPVKKLTGDPTGLNANHALAGPPTASAQPELRLERAAGVPRQDREDLGDEMDWNHVEASWQTFRGEVQANWWRLTSDHLDAIAGRRVCLAKKLEEAYGVTGDDAERQIRAFEARNGHPRPVSLR
jgi:uncharacterized protein YjbJ (UPF0337 family)